ncbi:MAG TPA: Xaa-Pro peptidase family protein [Solirubrobacterales bacterium]|nr:Xaa-Pro peptidase family protein [Solirubrobacterales bacterium]
MTVATTSLPPGSFTSEEYARRYERVREGMRDEGLDALLAYSTPKVRGAVRYLSGYSLRFTGAFSRPDGSYGQSGATAVLFPLEGEPHLVTDLPWDAQRAKSTSAVDEVSFAADFAALLGPAIASAGFERVGIDNWLILPAYHYKTLSETAPGVEFVPSRVVADACRVKSEAELELIRGAELMAMRASEAGLAAAAVGGTDVDVGRACIEAANRLGDLEPNGGHVICVGAATQFGTDLPTAAAPQPIERGDFVLIDMNTSYAGYAGDIARMCVAGTVADLDPRLRKLYDVTLEMNERVLERIKPGVKPVDLVEFARSIATAAGLGERMSGLLGHSLGLDIHEAPDFFYDAVPLEENVVIAIEPSLSLPGLGGTRIEDIVRVTADGCEVLTADCPKALRGTED